MVDLLDNFLNPLKVFLALASNQVRDEWKKLKQKYLQKEIAIKKSFNHATSPKRENTGR